MPHYSYNMDKPIADKTEHEIAEILKENGCKIKSFNNDRRYDILAERDGKIYKFEVKEDFSCERTGNVGLEFSCRGKPSGISTSEADFYVYKIHTPQGILNVMISSKRLKKMIEDHVFHRIVVGGDPNSNSKNYLFHLRDIVNNGKII